MIQEFSNPVEYSKGKIVKTKKAGVEYWVIELNTCFSMDELEEDRFWHHKISAVVWTLG